MKLIAVNMGKSRKLHATSPNASYQRDVRYVLKLNAWILGSIGIWPFAIRSIAQHVPNIVIVFYNSLMSFILMSCILHIIYDQKDLVIRLKVFAVVIFCVTAMIKYLILAIHRSKIRRCIEYVKYDWWQVTFGYGRDMMMKYGILGRNLTIIGTLFMYSCYLIYFTVLVPISASIKINNKTFRPLAYPIYSEFHQMQISPIYEIIYVMQFMCGYIIHSVTIGTYGMAALFATHACGQIQLIGLGLQSLLDGKNLEERAQKIHRRIAVIVKRHVRIIRFVTLVEELLREVCLIEFISSACTICLAEYFCIVDWHDNDRMGLMTYFMYFVSLCFNIYILCYIGELLVRESTQIGLMCYRINWYQLSPKSARCLVLIIAISSNPIKLSAGGMIDLSLMTFGNILKTSVVYLNFLRALVMKI